MHLPKPLSRWTNSAAAWQGKRKADSTRRSSQAVPHPSTNRALRRLTSEVGRDPVHSTRYGRQRKVWRRHQSKLGIPSNIKQNVQPDSAKYLITVAILAQGTHWAVAVMQAFLHFSSRARNPVLHTVRCRIPSLLLEFCAQKVFISLTYFGLPITSCDKHGPSRESQ